MTFRWPELLWLLAVVPLLVLAYAALLRRRKRTSLRYASLSMVRDAVGAAGWRRHVPPLLFIVAMALLIVAVARPQATLSLPTAHETVILAMDVSGSMRAADIQPSRIVAAQTAAKEFISSQPSATRIGIVAFAGSASVVQPPTFNREDLHAAIDRFQLQRATAIGSGLVVSLATIFPGTGIDLAALEARRGSRRDQQRDPARDRPAEPGKDAKPVAPGSYGSAAIVLLSDGQTTTGADPLEAAKLAAERGVRVYTVGIGTPAGEVLRSEGWSMRVSLDEQTLKAIASITQGEYFHAGSAPDLRQVYRSLSSRFVLEKRQMEVTALFTAAATLLAVIAAGLSVLWFNRIL